MAILDEDAAVRDERSLRQLLSRPHLAEFLWDPSNRFEFKDRFESMYGERIALEIERKVNLQYVVTAFREIRAELLRLDEGKRRLYPGNVFKVVQRLESIDLDPEAQYLRVQVAVISGLHHLLQSSNVHKDWPEVRKMLKSGEDSEEAERVSEHRSISTLLLKKCARLAQSNKQQEMEDKVRQFQQEWPVATLISDLRQFCEKATASLDSINSDAEEEEEKEDEASAEGTELSEEGKKRTREVDSESENSEPPSERKRSRVSLNATNTPNEKNVTSDSDNEQEGAADGSTSVRTPRYKTPTKSIRRKRGGPSSTFGEEVATAIGNLKDSVRKLREATGEDPLEAAIALGKSARRGSHRRTPSTKTESPEIKPLNYDEDNDSESDDSDDAKPWKTPLQPVISRNLQLDRSPITAGNTKSGGKDVHKHAFSEIEDECLIKGLEKFGWGNWNSIDKHAWPLTTHRGRAALLRRAKILEKTGKIKREDFVAKFVAKRRGGKVDIIPVSDVGFEKCLERDKNLERTPKKAVDNAADDPIDLDADKPDDGYEEEHVGATTSRKSSSPKKRTKVRKSTRKKARLSFSD